MLIKALEKHEFAVFKNLRLKAIQDSPLAFGETLQEANNRDDETWQLYFRSMLPPNKQRMFVVFADAEPIGSFYALQDKNDASTGRIGGMWVDSSKRASGIGRNLIHKAEEWASNNEFKQIKLWVFKQKAGAHCFYKKLGFNETGVVDTSYGDEKGELIEMVMTLVK